ncbi:MAG: hypothetical protein JZU45_13415 [Methyloversatilis discipulorum]|uniref:hypothetical protein n=1 Tax=Methyloversatilis discipulorum TaxID=1119528 RepID=UPI0026EE8EDE|nr:hypothetical protein [Methyloversatilis discipulorum]MBV5287072.1 hypothetical protein [Methyloversatilis discipulorum]
MNDFSIFEYLYRDAGNYKIWCSVLLAGRATPADAEIVKAGLDRGEFFIAEQIGVPAAHARADGAKHMPNEDDHVWHEFSELRAAEADEIVGEPWGTVAELGARFGSVLRWDQRLSPHW